MNQTINISLPKSLADLAKQQVKTGYYSTLSEVVRDALRNHLINPSIPTFKLSQKAEKVLEQGMKDYRAGKTIPFKSFSDLDKLTK